MPITFDFSELRGLIVSRYGTCAKFAEATGLSRSQLSDRLRNKIRFLPDEVCTACDLLGIPAEEIGKYFFTPKV